MKGSRFRGVKHSIHCFWLTFNNGDLKLLWAKKKKKKSKEGFLSRLNSSSCPTGGSSEVLCKGRWNFCPLSDFRTFPHSKGTNEKYRLAPSEGAEPGGVNSASHWETGLPCVLQGPRVVLRLAGRPDGRQHSQGMTPLLMMSSRRVHLGDVCKRAEASRWSSSV